ncbi:MAG: hypothetical protein HQ515_19195 [Phycisphaeraceae bacterium]|nr:hypothetical protein [Phycisphaeraceae bacterium]
MAQKPIEQVQAQHTGAWMQIPGVVGTAVGLHEGKPCILVMTSVPLAQIESKIPRSVDDYPVIVEETGEFEALEPE